MEPVILVVVSDRGARALMVAEFGRYERDYRVEAVSDGDAALARLGELRSSGDAVAMVVADLASGPVDGVELLSRVRAASPTTKRVLLLDWGLRPDQMDAVGRAADVGSGRLLLDQADGPPRRGIPRGDHREPWRLGVDDDTGGGSGESGRRFGSWPWWRDP